MIHRWYDLSTHEKWFIALRRAIRIRYSDRALNWANLTAPLIVTPALALFPLSLPALVITAAVGAFTVGFVIWAVLFSVQCQRLDKRLQNVKRR